MQALPLSSGAKASMASIDSALKAYVASAKQTQALAATVVALALGFSLRQDRGGRSGAGFGLNLAARVLSLGYAVPGAVVAIGILVPLGWAQQRWPEAGWTPWFTGTLLGVVYAYLVRFSSVALQSVEAGYARMPPSVDETARMLGAGRGRVFWRLHLPLLRKPALAAMLLVRGGATVAGHRGGGVAAGPPLVPRSAGRLKGWRPGRWPPAAPPGSSRALQAPFTRPRGSR